MFRARSERWPGRGRATFVGRANKQSAGDLTPMGSNTIDCSIKQ